MDMTNIIADTISNVGAAKAANAKGNVLNQKIDKVDYAAQEFEAVFISQMLTHMWSGIETNEMFGGGHAEDIYRSLLIEEYGKVIAKQGGLGIADHVKAEMIALQGQGQNNKGDSVNGTE
jgi:Rod binding domain-containing protein